jgi:hypothetical protein
VCGRDEKRFLTTAVHLTPKHAEACDGFSFVRYKVATGISEESLLRAKAAKAIAARCPSAVGETNLWLHFKSASGLYVSVRRFRADAHQADKIGRFEAMAKERGSPVQLPKSVIAASKVAEVFASEGSDDPRVTVGLERGRVTLSGEGATGGASHRAKVTYRGPEVAFTVGPKIFQAIVDKYSEVQVTPGRLIVSSGRLFYSTSVKRPGAAPEPKIKVERGNNGDE